MRLRRWASIPSKAGDNTLVGVWGGSQRASSLGRRTGLSEAASGYFCWTPTLCGHEAYDSSGLESSAQVWVWPGRGLMVAVNCAR